MFCGECGTKNEKNAQFCENCGSKLVVEKSVAQKTNSASSQKKPTNESFSMKLKQMPKKKKILLGVVVAIILILIVSYTIISNKLSPRAIAKDYFLAVTNVDTDKLYQYMDIEKSEFTNKDIFVKLATRDMDEDDKVKVANYKIGNVEKSNDGLTATVSISYVLEGEDDPDTVKVTMVKQKSKKYLFFDDWRISNNMAVMSTKKDYQIKVLKDTKLTIEGIEVNKKYIDKDLSNETYDVYKMPAMFTEKYEMKLALPLGFEVEDTVNVSSYSNYTFKFSEKNLPENLKKQMMETTKSGLQTLYNGAKDQKSFDEIKQVFANENVDLSDLQETYTSLSNSLSNSGLNAIEFTEVTLSDLDLTEDGYRASVKTKYKYTISYTSLGETKTHDSSSSDTMYIYYTFVDNEFKIIDASSLNTYFSRYY